MTEIGCIHTCQGLELDYIGVILGPDLLVRNGVLQTHAEKRSKMDSSIKGYKKLLEEDAEEAKKKAAEIIKNTYRTLMTRGRKGCFVYSVDPETNRYLIDSALGATLGEVITNRETVPTLPFRILEEYELERFVNAVPIFDLKIAAGSFSAAQWIDECKWAELPDPFVAKKGFFVVKVVGESMNKRIPNGSWCIFKASPEGSRQGRVVLVQHLKIQDPDSGQFTVKIYDSKKIISEDSWAHERIILRPDSRENGFKEIVLRRDDATELTVVGEFVAVLG